MSGAGNANEKDILDGLEANNIIVRGRREYYLPLPHHPTSGEPLSDQFVAGVQAACNFLVPYIVDARRDAIVARDGALGGGWPALTKIAQNGAGFIERTDKFVKMKF